MARDKNVLVGVLKSKNDLRILFREHWYRIPLAFAPQRRFTHIAFYQPTVFGKEGKRILYYARVLKKNIIPRIELLPKETRHPRANDNYLKITFRRIEKLRKQKKQVLLLSVAKNLLSKLRKPRKQTLMSRLLSLR